MDRIVGLNGEPLSLPSAAEAVWLPADTPFGNLGLKTLHMVNRLVHANRRLDETEEKWAALLKQSVPGMDNPGPHHRFSADEVVVHLRRTVDELIGLLWLLRERVESGTWPTRIGSDSIGTARDKDGRWLLPLLEKHGVFLATLNDLANAQKHSFIDSDAQVVGAEEPCVIALGLKGNNLASGSTHYVVSLNDLVTRFNRFYLDAMTELRTFVGKV